MGEGRGANLAVLSPGNYTSPVTTWAGVIPPASTKSDSEFSSVDALKTNDSLSLPTGSGPIPPWSSGNEIFVGLVIP
jgi:hypothetical protein